MSGCETKPKFDNWVPLSDADIELEYKVEYLNHVKHDVGEVFPTMKGFKDAVKKAQATPYILSKEEDDHMSYRSHCPDIDCIIDMSSGYSSWPQYRNEGTINAIDEGFKENKPMKMPIVLQFRSGRLRVMSGNTRLDLARINRASPIKVILVPIEK